MTIRPTRRPARNGSVIPLLAICVVALFGFVALAIDLGMMMVARTECQNAADAAALAAARTLDNKVPPGTSPDAYDNQKPAAEANALAAVTSNVFLNANFTDTRVDQLRVGLYDYDTSSQTFNAAYPASKPSGKAWSSVEVIVNGDQPAYFGRVLGINTMPMTARAVAVHRPRDMALVLDYTGSMGYGTLVSHGIGEADQSSYRWYYNSGDPVYPQFGHYQRYLSYTTGSPLGNQKDAAVGNRPNPLRQTATYIQAPYVYAPANVTVENDNGKPVIKDFRYDPAATGPNVTTGDLTNAFHALSYALTRTTAGTDLLTGPTPAPANFLDQSDSPVPFDSDRWPRKRGHVPPAPGVLPWTVTSSTGAAVHAAELLGWTTQYTGAANQLTTLAPPAGESILGRSWSNLRDATWERYGYDLDVAHYIANRNNGAVWDPRYDAGLTPKDALDDTPNPPIDRTYTPVVTPGKFKGYTMGPGYWGKTFFIWPPDPRWGNPAGAASNGSIAAPLGTGVQPHLVNATNPVKDTSGNWICDWRRRFFNTADNAALLTNNVGITLAGAAPNYPAILAWIKSGPQVFPPNLRSGRVRYYTTIPNDVNTGTGTLEERADKRFWKEYIDFVLTSDATNGQTLAGIETQSWPEGVTLGSGFGVAASSTLTQYDVDGPSAPAPNQPPDPRPYMRYIDNPSRPRMHLWFGPVSMMAYIDNKNFYSGTLHQAQSWQLKAGVNSAIDDIKANHPNDLVGLAFFTKRLGVPADSYRTIMVPIGQDWTNLKNALFFPRPLLDQIKAGSITAEVRPYDDTMTYTGWTEIPNAQNNTDPNTGLALAFNILSPSQYVNPDPARRGRRGAAKLVIFETDGVPNSAQRVDLSKAGYDTYYTNIGGNHPSYGDNLAGASNAAYEIVNQIRKPMSANNNPNVDSGLTLPNNAARVYAIGFGDIFSTTAGPAAAGFLLEIQKRGGTSKQTDTAIPAYQIITGTYPTRIANLRTALERILQAGVQVTLIE